MATLAALRKKSLKLLRDYENAEPEARTPIAKRLAETFVDARSHFTDADGFADWRGKTYPYRVWVRDLFSDANLRGDEANRVQSAVRYHLGAILRERLDDDELARLGMMQQSPRERSMERRHTRTAVLNALNAKDVAGGALLALTATKAILERVDPDEVAGLDENAQAVAEATLKDLERRIRRLRNVLR